MGVSQLLKPEILLVFEWEQKCGMERLIPIRDKTYIYFLNAYTSESKNVKE